MASQNRFIVDTPHDFSTFLLSQFCGVSNDPYTGFCGWIMCKSFKLSVKGARNVNYAINNLPVFRSPDEKLTFGWAFNNLLRTRAVHDDLY